MVLPWPANKVVKPPTEEMFRHAHGYFTKQSFRALVNPNTSVDLAIGVGSFLNDEYFGTSIGNQEAARATLAIRLYEFVKDYNMGEINARSFIFGVDLLASYLNGFDPSEWHNLLDVVYNFLPLSGHEFFNMYPLKPEVDKGMLREEQKSLLLPIKDGTAANPQQFGPAISEERHARQRPPRSKVSAINPNLSGTTMVEARALSGTTKVEARALTEAERVAGRHRMGWWP